MSQVPLSVIFAFFAWAAPMYSQGAVQARDQSAIKRGEYLFHASGGCSCHALPKGDDTLGGGRPLKTPFGTFYSTNITPDGKAGIGHWSFDDFYNAMAHGERKNGDNLYPTFPYTSFARMRKEDVADLYAYLQTLKPSPRENRPNEALFPLSLRLSVTPWKWLFFHPQPVASEPKQSPAWNRGAYLAQAVAHCGECHSPRNIFGAVETSHYLAGAATGPDGPVPNITPDKKGIGDWDTSDLVDYLKTGMKPNGDFAGSVMAEVIDDGYKYLSEDDLNAIATYVKSVPALPR